MDCPPPPPPAKIPYLLLFLLNLEEDERRQQTKLTKLVPRRYTKRIAQILCRLVLHSAGSLVRGMSQQDAESKRIPHMHIMQSKNRSSQRSTLTPRTSDSKIGSPWSLVMLPRFHSQLARGCCALEQLQCR